jgi:hypothetical protein
MTGARLDHVQVAIPAGGEDQERAFFRDLVGLTEIPRPPELRGRGGCWFQLGDQQLHIGIDPDFRPARKAHVAIAATNLPGLRNRLTEAGCEVRDDVPIDGRSRFFSADPFGNRIEFVEA